ncbi:unnamed protein product [Rotaria sp. Silwood1]|nr:unnamed protein product [Rotaria sp. Silwood1]
MASSPNLSSKYIVLSYNKKHEELVLNIYNYLKNEKLPVWIYVQDGINKDICQRDSIIENISILLCFITPMYQASKDCQKQVELIKSERIPIIACRLLPNWKPSGWLKLFYVTHSIFAMIIFKHQYYMQNIINDTYFISEHNK